MASADSVTLQIGGQRFGGWKSVGVELDLDTGASSFDLDVTKRDPERDEDWRIEAGSACKVLIGSETVIDGYVDKTVVQLDGESHSIQVSGRSKTADLIDCAAIAKPGSWKNRKLEDIANELAGPFNVKISAEASTAPPLRQFALQPGETVWEAITRACLLRGLLPVPQPDGSVKLITAKIAGGTSRIVEGQQPLRFSGTHDVTDRFSQYIAKGQSAGDDQLNGKAASAPRAEAKDPAVKRYRPLIVMAEDQADQATLKKRAEWEASVRAARSQSSEVTLIGWQRPGGGLWALMNGVDLDLPSAWISDKLMVAGVRFSLDEGGRLVTLRLVRPEAYSQQPVPAEAQASKIKKAGRKSAKERKREEGQS